VLVQGSTRVTLIIGHPIAQVSSPALFNRRFEDLGLDSVMIPADIAPEQLPHFLRLLRGWGNADGCVVTVPYKRAVVEHLDELTERGQRL
jgi:shikimate dehydrogenase